MLGFGAIGVRAIAASMTPAAGGSGNTISGSATLPAPTVHGTISATPFLKAVTTLPAPTIHGTLSLSGLTPTFSGRATLPAPTIHGTLQEGASFHGTATFPVPTIRGTFVHGSSLQAHATLPAPTIAGTFNFGTLPTITIAGFATLPAPTIISTLFFDTKDIVLNWVLSPDGTKLTAGKFTITYNIALQMPYILSYFDKNLTYPTLWFTERAADALVLFDPSLGTP